jgi:hypothetical protein
MLASLAKDFGHLASGGAVVTRVSCTYIVSALLTWRRSSLAAPAFLTAMGLLLPLFWFLSPGARVPFLSFSVLTLLPALLGYRYLTNAGGTVA